MAKQGRTTLKDWFKTGKKPTEGQFSSLIDSIFNLSEDTLPIDKVDGLALALEQSSFIYIRMVSELPVAGVGSTLYVKITDGTFHYYEGGQWNTGVAGLDGASAYEVAVANGFTGTVPEWLISLKGQQGEKGVQGDQGIQGIQGVQGDQGVAGDDGQSAYELAVVGGFVGTESEWLASLKGADAVEAAVIVLSDADVNGILEAGNQYIISTAVTIDLNLNEPVADTHTVAISNKSAVIQTILGKMLDEDTACSIYCDNNNPTTPTWAEFTSNLS